MIDLRGSLGFVVEMDEASIGDVIHGSPADESGLSPVGRIVAVNGRRFTPEVVADAITATPTNGKIELLVEDADFLRTCHAPRSIL